jgi:NFU1 iron-sulfur cluster scaffold homolog, mitochondrial
MSTDAPSIHITAEPQTLPYNCLYRVDRNLFVGTLYVSDYEVAKQAAPLVAAIMDAVEGVRGVRISQSEILVTMNTEPSDWRTVARETGAAIRGFLQEGHRAVAEGALELLTGNDEVRKRVQIVIDEHLNPNLASHGGWVEIQASDGVEYYMTMGGGCQGCGSAAATMRQGIETSIRSEVPEAGGIHDATDHAAGANPYM